VDLPYDITTEPDRVFFLKSATQLMVRGPLPQSLSLFGQGFEVLRLECYRSPTNRFADGVLPEDSKTDISDVLHCNVIRFLVKSTGIGVGWLGSKLAFTISENICGKTFFSRI
jgi:hypothetical protein